MFTYILATLLIAWTAIVDGSSGEDCGNEDACDSLLEQHPFQLMRSLDQLYLDEDLLQHLGDSRNPYKCYNRGKVYGPSPLCCNPIFWSSDDENWMVSLVSRENNEEKPNAELVFRLVLLDKRGGGEPKGIRSRYFSEDKLKAEFQKQVIHAYAVAPEKIRRRKHNKESCQLIDALNDVRKREDLAARQSLEKSKSDVAKLEQKVRSQNGWKQKSCACCKRSSEKQLQN